MLFQGARSQVTGWPQNSRYHTSSKISGVNLYRRLNYWVVFCGGDALANPSALVGVEAPGEAVITLTAEKFGFELEQSPEDAAYLRLVVCASAPQGNDITRAFGKVAIIGGPLPII